MPNMLGLLFKKIITLIIVPAVVILYRAIRYVLGFIFILYRALKHYLNPYYDVFIKYLYRKAIPGPSGLPFVGHLPYIDVNSPHIKLKEWAEKYGPIYTFRWGQTPVVVLSDPNFIQTVFTRTAACGRLPLHLKINHPRGCGIVACEREMWRDHRMMTRNCLKLYTEYNGLLEKIVLFETINYLLIKFPTHHAKSFDAHPIIRHTVASVILSLIFGTVFRDDYELFNHQLDLCFSATYLPMPNIDSYFWFLKYFPSIGDILEKCKTDKAQYLKFLHELAQDHCDLITNDENAFIDTYIQQMIMCNYNLDLPETREQLYHVICDLFGSSINIISSTINWTLFNIMMTPDVQNKIHSELDKVVGPNRLPRLSDMKQLSYIRACILEAQRLSTLIPIGLPHWTLLDIQLQSYLIPRDTMVIGLQYAVDHTPIGCNSLKLFKPTRFLKSGLLNQSNDFTPVSAGLRDCPGDELVDQCLFLIISIIFHQFLLKPAKLREEPEELCEMPNINTFYSETFLPTELLLCAIPGPNFINFD
ncbi:hypothetical protein CHUAL_003546 [Chamberlinius hualienensis]